VRIRWRLVQPQASLRAGPRKGAEPSVRRRRVPGGPRFSPEERRGRRANFQSAREPVLQKGAAAPEEHLQGEFRPVREFLLAPLGHPWREGPCSVDDLPHLRPGGV